MLTDRIGFMSQGKLEEKLVFRSQKMGALSALTQLVLWCVGMIVLGFTGGWNSATWRDIEDFQKDIEGAGMAKKKQKRDWEGYWKTWKLIIFQRKNKDIT